MVRELLPRERFGPAELLRWLEETQDSNERARRSHAKRRAALRASPPHPSLNRRCNTRGMMVLVRDDLAVFTSRSGEAVEFVPWPSEVERELCM